MNVSLKRRLDHLEAIHQQDDEQLSIWRCIVCHKRGAAPDWRVPVIGWRHNGTDIMRLDGETDEELQERALQFAKDQQTEPGCGLSFLQISDFDMEGD